MTNAKKQETPRPGKRHQITFTDKPIVQQHQKNDANINNIMKRFRQTGLIESINRQQPQFGDFTDIPTYQEALDFVHKAEDHFFSLPSDIRSTFENDPGQFLDFMTNPENEAECIEMGLKKAPTTLPTATKEATADKPELTDKQTATNETTTTNSKNDDKT